MLDKRCWIFMWIITTLCRHCLKYGKSRQIRLTDTDTWNRVSALKSFGYGYWSHPDTLTEPWNSGLIVTLYFVRWPKISTAQVNLGALRVMRSCVRKLMIRNKVDLTDRQADQATDRPTSCYKIRYPFLLWRGDSSFDLFTQNARFVIVQNRLSTTGPCIVE